MHHHGYACNPMLMTSIFYFVSQGLRLSISVHNSEDDSEPEPQEDDNDAHLVIFTRKQQGM